MMVESFPWHILPDVLSFRIISEIRSNKLFVFMFVSVSVPWAPSRVDMCVLQIFIIIIIINDENAGH